MNSWEGINEFVAVTETGSFTAASKRLGISTAQVSRLVGALEARLSAKLFYRTTRKVTVTELGNIYYQHCRQVLDGLEEADRAVTNLQQIPTGKLHITAPVTYGEKTIAPLVNNFVGKYPELTVQLQLTNQQIDLVDTGCDIAIRLGKLDDSSMIAKRLAPRVQHVCAAPAFISKYGTPHSLSELEQYNCLLGTLDYWRFQEQGTTKLIRVKGSIRCNSGVALLDAALKGLGIVQLPDYYVESYLQSGQLLPMLENFQEKNEAVWALYPQNRHLSPKVRLLLDYFEESLG